MKRRALLLGAVALVMMAIASPVALGGKGGKTIYDSTVSPLPGNLPSLGAEAYAFSQLGDEVTFAGDSRALKTVTVTLSSWGCQSGSWNNGNCVSAKNATFAQPITLNIYDPSDTTTPIATATQTFNVPYRPSTDSVHCTDGQWFDKKQGCFNGLASNVTFDFKSQNVTLPDMVVYGISYNTSGHGPSPMGYANPCNASSGGCPYDSLNIALAPEVSVGSKPHPDTIWWDTQYAGNYCDNGAEGVGVFRLDSPTSACWGGYVPAVQFTASKAGKGGGNDNSDDD
jgi:hypothetical protein